MTEYWALFIVCILIILINLPFGYWRQGSKKFSLKWILSIHLPIPFVILLRVRCELDFQLYTFPFTVASFFIGQQIGAWLYKQRVKN